MFKKLSFSIFIIILIQVTFAEKKVTTWYAGTKYIGEVKIFGHAWNCNNGKCILKGSYGNGLSMGVCKALAKKVGVLGYYSNSAGKKWSKTENSLKLEKCNGNKNKVTHIAKQGANKKNKTIKSKITCNSKTAIRRLNAFKVKYTSKLKQKNIKLDRGNELGMHQFWITFSRMAKTNPSKVCQTVDEAEKKLAKQK
ncbi:MAG: hypothetical protein L3J51_05310 [Cocleimonas sp.]|nr:hypothetical protein [Cocleimonas sp.]